MRHKLENLDKLRTVFKGTFSRFGFKRAYKGPDLKTVLLTNITTSSDEFICDHLWFNFTKGFESLSLEEGDIIEFHARVKEYEKGYKGRNDNEFDSPIENDYKLSFPTKLKKIGKENVAKFLL